MCFNSTCCCLKQLSAAFSCFLRTTLIQSTYLCAGWSGLPLWVVSALQHLPAACGDVPVSPGLAGHLVPFPTNVSRALVQLTPITCSPCKWLYRSPAGFLTAPLSTPSCHKCCAIGMGMSPLLWNKELFSTCWKDAEELDPAQQQHCYAATNPSFQPN